MATGNDFGVVFDLLAGAYPNAKADERTAALYSDMLADIDGAALLVAVRQVIASSKFFPTVAEIRAAVSNLHAVADDAPDAATAWRMLAARLTIAPDGFEWRGKDALHPRVVKAACAFGEARFVNRMVDDEGTNFAQFRDIYNTFAKRDEQTRGMLPGTANYIAALADKLSMTKALAAGSPPAPVSQPVEPVPVHSRMAEALEAVANAKRPMSRQAETRRIERVALAARLQQRVSEFETRRACACDSDRALIDAQIAVTRKQLATLELEAL